MHGHLNVKLLKHLSLCIVTPLILLLTLCAKLQRHFKSFPLLSNNFVFFLILACAYDTGCALEPLFSHLHPVSNRRFYILFIANTFAHFIIFLQAIFSSLPNVYYILIFSFTFPFPIFIIWFTHL